MEGLIILDVGTTSTRAVLFDRHGRSLFLSQRHNPPDFKPDGWVEQSATTWAAHMHAALADCAARAAASGISVEAVALTSLRSAVLPLDRAGEPLHPVIMWQDKRTDDLCRKLARFDPLVYGKTGMKISSIFSAVKMKWFRTERPDIYRRTGKMAGIQDYFLQLLTGELVTDQSCASRTNLMNLHTRAWDDELLGLFELERDQLCVLVEPGSIVGGLCPTAAAAIGLAAGTPVIAAGGDQQCAALGLGLLEAGRLVVNTGTGSYLLCHSDRPALDPLMRVACTASALPGACIVEASLPTSGTLYGWFSRQFYQAGADGQAPFEAINAEAAACPPGANGVMLLPHFNGSASPHWNPADRGLFFNLNLGTTRADMARAVLEGIAAELAENLELLEALSAPVRSVSAAGGLSRFGAYNQILADSFDREVVRRGSGEATAQGAWMAAAVRVGFFASHAQAFQAVAFQEESETYLPDPGHARLYSDLKEKRRVLYRAISQFRDGL